MDNLPNLIEVFVELAFVAIAISVALEQVFDTRWWQKNMGKGIDGQPSRWLPNFELRPWVATAIGMILAYAFGLQFIKMGLNIIPETGPWWTWGNDLDKVLTGLILGGGSKAVIKFARRFATTSKDIKEALS